MRYFLTQGQTEQFILRAAARDNAPIPKSIQDAPELLEGLQLYYRAFMDLTSCRAALYGAEGPIKWTAIVMWADVNGLDGEQLEDLMYHIGKMDVVYLEHKAKKIKAR